MHVSKRKTRDLEQPASDGELSDFIARRKCESKGYVVVVGGFGGITLKLRVLATDNELSLSIAQIGRIRSACLGSWLLSVRIS
jgi:hypothetical protein